MSPTLSLAHSFFVYIMVGPALPSLLCVALLSGAFCTRGYSHGQELLPCQFGPRQSDTVPASAVTDRWLEAALMSSFGSIDQPQTHQGWYSASRGFACPLRKVARRRRLPGRRG